MSTDSMLKQPEIALPKGGGAIRSIGDTFKPNSLTGTGSYSIPVSIPKSRDFTPVLSIDYNSGTGNGIFGLGFSLSLSKITRRTSQGIPQYTGNDIFLLNGSELVPKENSASKVGDYLTLDYLVRIEGSFSTIKQFVKEDGSDSYWEVRNTKNECLTFGADQLSRISNPKNESQIFEWLISSAQDAKGSKHKYNYKTENTDGIPSTELGTGHSYNNRYISSIEYGNYEMNGVEKFAFTVVFDFGEYDLENLNSGGNDPFTASQPWSFRPDSYSSFLSGFEIRTSRLCSNILVFHNFEKELGDPCLVKRLALSYTAQNNYQAQIVQTPSTLNKIVFSGHRRLGKKATDPYDIQEMPPLEFGFSQLVAPKFPTFRPLQINGGSIPGRLSKIGFLPVDLDQEGITGLLYENSGLAYFEPKGHGEYGFPKKPKRFPNFRNSQEHSTSFVDLEGNGVLSMVVKQAIGSGFFKGQDSEHWSNFIPFKNYPNNLVFPKPEIAGLSHNGKTDLLVVNEEDILLYESKGELGYSNPIRKQLPEGFPSIKNGDQKTYCGFEDLIGDGLPHRVQISSGKIDVWPDLGYGNFGDKLTLSNAPKFDLEFDIQRLFFADIDGSGTKDIVYVHTNHIQLFFNQSGNSFSEPIEIQLPETFSDTDKIQFADVLGNGTTCLLFSKLDVRPRHYFFNFNGEIEINSKKEETLKPHLLNFLDNNLGATTEIQYASSIKFYLEDKKNGRPWITKLPFPVQVVERVTCTDQVSKSHYSNRYKYHDGYYDVSERIFRGFGFVESWDSQTFEEFQNSASKHGLQAISEENFVPPVYKKSWFHTGASFENRSVLNHYQKEFFQGDSAAYSFPDTFLNLPADEQNVETVRQALVALNGQPIREETYAADPHLHPGLSKIPYSVNESNKTVSLYQKLGMNPYAVYLITPRESISYSYERNANDPRIQQNFVLKTDHYGNSISACTVHLPRRSGNAANYPQQEIVHAELSWNGWVSPPIQNLYCHLSCEQQNFEITGLQLGAGEYYSFDRITDELKDIDVEKRLNIIPYSAVPNSGVQARQLVWHRIYFWDEALSGSAGLGVISELGLYHHKEEAAFDKQFPVNAFDGYLIDDSTYNSKGYLSNIIYTEGGYFFDETNGYWWNKGITQSYYDKSQFYLASIAENAAVKQTQSDPNPQNQSLYTKVEVRYDSYSLNKADLIRYLDATTKNSIEVEVDYVTMAPYQLSDINNNIHQVLFDPLGQVIVTSLFGTENGVDSGGMRLYQSAKIPADYKPIPLPSFDEILDPQNQSKYLQGATSYFYYDLHAWKTNRQPVCSIGLQAFEYWRSPVDPAMPLCETSIEYSDGLGRIAETKKRVPGGLTFLQDANGNLVHDSGQAKQIIDDRWQTSGRNIYNNKGKVYKEYLPYFINSPLYREQEQFPGPPPKVMIYDPLNRLIRINLPKGFFKKIEFTAWEQKEFDENDTILDSDYYKNVYPTASAEEKAAIDETVHCYNTPSIKILDNRGHQFLQSENNLGNVSAETFQSISTPAVSETAIYDALVQAEYLTKDKEKPTLTWVSEKFTPYREGFNLNLPSQFSPMLDAITTILRQNGLWTLLEKDIQGRLTNTVDPRLYYGNISEQKNDYNFRYQYSMEAKNAELTDSIDAGIHRKLNTVFKQPFWEFTARDYCHLTRYDTLQRKISLESQQITTKGVIKDYSSFKLLESFEYGEILPHGVINNLKGHIHTAKDQSGVLTNSSYTMQGDSLFTSKQLASDYKAEIDWNTKVNLEPKIYKTSFKFNALKLHTSETTDDDTITSKEYDEAGKLITVSTAFADGTEQAIIESIEYNANDQKEKIKYGNQIVTKYAYEASTLRLQSLLSTRLGTSGAVENIQDLEYTYDPIGNVVRKADSTYDDVFYSNDKVSPVLLYSFDALYRLKTSNGRQHIGVNNSSYQNNSKDSFMQGIFGPKTDVKADDQLENYTAQFDYDDAGNLIRKTRTSQSKKVVSRNLDVEDASNRLSAFKYDPSGNMMTLNLGSTVNLTFDSFENLTKAGVIERVGQPDDGDYYTYDSNSLRNRKVSEKWAHGSTVSQIDETIYIGNYEIINEYKGTEANESNRIYQRQSLRVMDHTTCVAIINYISEDKTTPTAQKSRTFRFQMDNNLGSVTLEMSEKAELISYEEYFPFGGTAIITGTEKVEVELKNYRYSGKERDNSTGLYYYGHRYYAPWLGRWIKPDPSGTVDGLNVFAFVGGNPVTRTDSDGFNWTVVFASGTYKITGSRPGISGVPTGKAAGDIALSYSRNGSGGYNPLLTNPQAAKFINADDGKRQSAGIALCHILSANYIANMFVHILNNSSSPSDAISSLTKMHEATTGLTSPGLASATALPNVSQLSELLNGMARHIHNLPIGHSRTNSSIQEHDDFEVVASSTGFKFSPRAMRSLNFRLAMKEKHSSFDHAAYNPRTVVASGKTFIKSSTGVLEHDGHYYIGAHDIDSTHRQALEELMSTSTSTSPPVYSHSTSTVVSMDYVSTTTHPTHSATTGYTYTGQFTTGSFSGTVRKGGVQGSLY